jgi:hypothetical protein
MKIELDLTEAEAKAFLTIAKSGLGFSSRNFRGYRWCIPQEAVDEASKEIDDAKSAIMQLNHKLYSARVVDNTGDWIKEFDCTLL